MICHLYLIQHLGGSMFCFVCFFNVTSTSYIFIYCPFDIEMISSGVYVSLL